MSRKTRKLMWSVPLIAAIAVIGALAAFMTLAPNDASAQAGLPGMVEDLKVGPHTDGTPQTELLVTWEEPTSGGPVTSYRIDISDDGDRWFSHVTDHGDGDLRLVYEGLKPTATKYFRVFALNEDLEAGPGTDTMGTTSASHNPEKPTGLTATRSTVDGTEAPQEASAARTVIRLSWVAPEDPPGAPVKFYRIQYRIGQGNWRTLADQAVPGVMGARKTWSHSGLRADVTRQYRVFAQNEPRGPGNGIGMSGPSDGATGSTATSEAPGPPTIPVIGLSPSATDVHLKWTAPTDPAGDPVSHYRIQARIGTATELTDYKNLHTGKHIDRTNVYNFGGVDLKTAGITVPQNIPEAGLVVDIRIAAINRANTDEPDQNDATTPNPNVNWLELADVPVGHHSAPKRAGTPTVKRDNERHQGRSGLNVTWPKAEFIVDAPADVDISYVLVGAAPTETEIEHANTLGDGGAAADKPGYDDDGLKTETTRTYQLYALNDTIDTTITNASVRSFPSGTASLTTARPTKPNMPTGFTVVPDGHTEIKVSWMPATAVTVAADQCDGTEGDKSDGSECGDPVITGYKIQRAPVNADGQPGRFTDLTTVKPIAGVNSYTDNDLEPGSSFFYQVFAVNSQRNSDPTAPKSATTHPAGIPTQPGGLVAQAGEAGEIKLCWYEQNVPNPEGQTDEGIPVIGYRIVVLGDDGETETALVENTMSQNTEYTATGLMLDTEYTFRVYSITLGGVSTEYEEASATTADAMVPGAPTSSAMADSDTQITVSWTDPADDGGATITGYIIERRYTGDMMGDIPSDGYSGENGANRSFAFSNTMEWWETLNCKGMLGAVGSSADPTDTSNADVMKYCKHFLNTAPSNVTDSSVELSAEAKANVEALFAKRYVIIDDAMMMEYEDMGLMAETTYTYRVSAVNAAGRSMWSAAMATTEAAPSVTPIRPTITSVSVLQNSISVTWDPASNQHAQEIKVALFDLDANGDVVSLAMGYADNVHTITPAVGNPGAHTFTNVPAGTYKVGVVNFANREFKSIVSGAQTVSGQ